MNKKDKKNSNKNFGFAKVTPEQKRFLVDNVFTDVATKYDLMNDLMSFGVHRIWKSEFCGLIPNLNSKIIDVASGTGDISFRIHNLAKKQNKSPNIVACDINADMLEIGRDRAINRNILDNLDFVVADAENLPFHDNSFDYYTIAFGIRNVINVANALKEAHRVLKPTGKFLCLEFSKVQDPFMKPLYDFYSFNMIPNIGRYVANNKSAYQYLAESISLFPDQEDFKTMIMDAGFQDVAYQNLTLGVASIHYGFKG